MFHCVCICTRFGVIRDWNSAELSTVVPRACIEIFSLFLKSHGWTGNNLPKRYRQHNIRKRKHSSIIVWKINKGQMSYCVIFAHIHNLYAIEQCMVVKLYKLYKLIYGPGVHIYSILYGVISHTAHTYTLIYTSIYRYVLLKNSSVPKHTAQ